MSKDVVWLRGERAPRRDVKILNEERTFVFEEQGEKREVEGWRVRLVRHEGSPPELGAALARIPQGDFATAEKQLALFAESETEWLAAHAGFHRANARRLRAQLEGEGHEAATALLGKWLEAHGDHWLAPGAQLARGEGAIDCALLDEAREAFTLLAREPAGSPWALLGRHGQARVELQANPGKALPLFEQLEKDALEQEWGHEAAQLARIGRAEALAKLEKPAEGAALLAAVVDHEAWQGTPARVRALNALADLCCQMGGVTAEGVATAGLLAALPFWTKVVRYSTGLPLERARALAGAHKACVAAGATERAAHMKHELAMRFATSRWSRAL